MSNDRDIHTSRGHHIYILRERLPAQKIFARVQRHFDTLRDVHGGKLIITDVAVFEHAHFRITSTLAVSKGRPFTQSQLMNFCESQLCSNLIKQIEQRADF